MFLVSLQLLSELFFTLKSSEGDMIENVYQSSRKVPLTLNVLMWRIG